jgi:hypothetical protein
MREKGNVKHKYREIIIEQYELYRLQDGECVIIKEMRDEHWQNDKWRDPCVRAGCFRSLDGEKIQRA